MPPVVTTKLIAYVSGNCKNFFKVGFVSKIRIQKKRTYYAYSSSNNMC